MVSCLGPGKDVSKSSSWQIDPWPAGRVMNVDNYTGTGSAAN